jgi:hypothetical protein
MNEKVMLSSLRADLDRELNGDWVAYPLWKGVRFKVSALTVPAYETDRDLMFKRLTQEYKEDARIPKDLMMVELGKLYSKHILHGWEGLDVEYTPEVADQTLTDPSYRAVIAAVEWCAAKISEIEAQFTKAEEGNSSPLSAHA